MMLSVMQAGTTSISKVFGMIWTQHQPGIEPIKPLGHYWVPPTLAFYDQQGLLRAYSPPGNSIGAPTPDPHGVQREEVRVCCMCMCVRCLILKPIFHQNAKYLASGTFASPNAKGSTSASPNARIPTCWYILALPLTPILKFALPPTPIPDASQWNIGGVGLSGVGAGVGRWACTFHVVYVNFICVGHPTQTRFSVEYGLKGVPCTQKTQFRERVSTF